MTEELNNNIPAAPADRKLLLGLIVEAVAALKGVDKIKEELKEIAGVATDKQGKLKMKAKTFNALVKAAYDADKVVAQIEGLQNSLDDLSVLCPA